MNNEHRAFAAGAVVLHGCGTEWAAWALGTALFPGAELIFKVPSACPLDGFVMLLQRNGLGIRCSCFPSFFFFFQ